MIYLKYNLSMLLYRISKKVIYLPFSIYLIRGFNIIIFILLFALLVKLSPVQYQPLHEYINNLVKLGVNFKIIKLTSIDKTHWHLIISNYPFICGVKPHIPFIFLCVISLLIMFIMDNIKIIILSILALIFIKALSQDFVKKHFNLGKCNVKEYINYIMNNLAIIITFFVKLILVSIFIRIIVRGIIFLLLNGNDSILSTVMVILLSIPVYYYILNFILKLIKKEDIIVDDFYIFNQYVIGKVNLYNIIPIISINLIIKYLFLLYIIVAMFIFMIVFIYLIVNLGAASFIWEIFKSKSEQIKEGLPLKSTLGPSSITMSFIAFSVYLQEACDKGFMEYIETQKIKPLPFRKETGVVQLGGTFNIMPKSELELYHPSCIGSPHTDRSLEYIAKIRQSPILNMVYNQTDRKGAWNQDKDNLDKWRITPRSFFVSDELVGSISRVENGNFFIINIIKHKINACTFMPSFFFRGDGTIIEYNNTVSETRKILMSRYGVQIPLWTDLTGGVVIFTQGEHIVGTDGLYKVWRPSPYFIEPNLLSNAIKDYYKLEINKMEQEKPEAIANIKRVQTGNFVNTSALNNIKKLVWENTLIRIQEIEFEHEHYSSEPLPRAAIFDNEYKADFIYRSLLKNFFNKSREVVDLVGIEVSQVEKNEIESMSKTQILSKHKYPTYSYPWEEQFQKKAWLRYNKRFPLDPSSCIEYYLRRDFPLKWEIWNLSYSIGCYVNLSKTGVIEGRARYVGSNPSSEYDHDFNPNYGRYCTLADSVHSPFYWESEQTDSRLKLIKKILDGYDFDPKVVGLTEMYGISINRLSFEFLNVEFEGIETGNLHDKYVLYSIIDTRNSHNHFYTKGNIWLPVCKQYFNFMDDNDEHTIRKFLDFIMMGNASYPYKSHLKNI